MLDAKYSPATNNNALVGRPRIAEVPQAVGHKGGKMVNLNIESLNQVSWSWSTPAHHLVLMKNRKLQQTYRQETSYCIVFCY